PRLVSRERSARLLRQRSLRRRPRAPRSRAAGMWLRPRRPRGRGRARDRAPLRGDRERRGCASVPVPIACDLPNEVRRAVAGVNAATLRRLAETRSRSVYPYAAVAAFGFGHPEHGKSALLAWRPGDAFPSLSKQEMDRFGVNIVRAGRAAEARNAGV